MSCQGRTKDGTRCTRNATDGGFCFQHKVAGMSPKSKYAYYKQTRSPVSVSPKKSPLRRIRPGTPDPRRSMEDGGSPRTHYWGESPDSGFLSVSPRIMSISSIGYM